MNAFQSSRPPVQPVEPRKPRPRHHRHRQSHRFMVLETTAKLSVNFVISVAALYGLAQLVPYNWSQQKKLQEIQAEGKRVEGRVNRLQTDFSRYFDPHQAKTIMQEQSNLLAPGQRPVVLVDRDSTKAAKAPSHNN